MGSHRIARFGVAFSLGRCAGRAEAGESRTGFQMACGGRALQILSCGRVSLPCRVSARHQCWEPVVEQSSVSRVSVHFSI